MAERYDYVVIGGGTAGCVVANRLSAGNKHTVLLLEAGKRDWSPFLHIPVGLMWLKDRFSWNYPVEADASRTNKIEHWRSGKVLGGTSSINGMLWSRGAPADFDEWAKQGCVGWDFHSVLPYFRRAETFEGGSLDFRGDSGPLHVSLSRIQHGLIDVFVDAAHNAGHHLNADYNADRHDGVGYIQVSQKRGLRQSTAVAYLAPARRRSNLRVQTGAHVSRILVEQRSAVGVEYIRNGKTNVVYCDNEIVLSAGAVASPKYLMLSGIGPANELRALDIPVVEDLPGVGKDLKNHPNALMLFEVNVPSLNDEFTPSRIAKHAINFILRGRGAATSGPAHAVIYGSHDGSQLDYTSTFGAYALQHAKPQDWSQREKLTKTNTVSARPGLLHPKARGTIKLKSRVPTDPPIINDDALVEPEDVAALIATCREARRVFATEPMRRHVVRELEPGDDVQTDDQWLGFLRRTTSAGLHLCGTCKMGIDGMSVVDPSLRVHGIERLRVIDASIMPTSPSGGTFATTVMIGEYGAELVLRAVEP